jgi:hypothetical protein
MSLYCEFTILHVYLRTLIPRTRIYGTSVAQVLYYWVRYEKDKLAWKLLVFAVL